jgi:signal peptidase
MKISAVFHTLYYVFLALIFSFAAFFLISLVPVKGNYIILTVLSGSMEPSIQTGSIVAIKPADSYKIGDVVTYGAIGKDNIPITHRIQEIKVINGQTLFVTKGDANESADGNAVAKKSVQGKVFLTLPYVGYAVSALRKPIGFFLIVAIPLLLIVIEEVRSIKKELKKKREGAITRDGGPKKERSIEDNPPETQQNDNPKG